MTGGNDLKNRFYLGEVGTDMSDRVWCDEQSTDNYLFFLHVVLLQFSDTLMYCSARICKGAIVKGIIF